MKTYLYRSGDGNEGNFPHHPVNLTETDCPFAAIKALLVNEYQIGSPARAHIEDEVQADGEAEFGTSAWVHEGPEGETAFDSAWRTAELEPMEPLEGADTLADVLGPQAFALYTSWATKP